MTFLATLGAYLAKGIAVISGLAPLLGPLFGSKVQAVAGVATTVINDLTAMGSVVVSAEALLGAGTGPAKLAAATPLIANIIKTSELVSGHEIADETLFIQGCTDITNGIAEVLNSLSAKKLQSSGQPPILVIPIPKQLPPPAGMAGTITPAAAA